MEQVKQSHFRHYLVVAAGMAASLVMALVYNSAGVFFPSILGALKVPLASLALYLTILSLMIAVSMPVWGQLFAKMDVRVLGVATAVIIAVGFAIFSFATSIWFFYVGGALIGLVLGFNIMMFIPTMINHWFKARTGFFMGLCMAFTGVGGVIFNPVAVALITSIGWRSTYRVFAVITLVLMVPLMLLVRNRPSDVGLRPYGDTGEAVGSATGAAPAPVLQGVSASVAMKSAAFYLCALFAICAGLISSVTQLFPTYVRTLPISAHNVGLGATLVSVVMASVALSKIFLGYLNDKSMVLAITFGVVCGAAGLLGMWILPTSAALLLISGALFGPLMALTTIQLPLLIRAVFGVREFSKIYSRVATFMSLIGAFGITIFSLVVASAGWAGLFALLVGLAVVVYLAVMLGIRFGKGLVFTKAELDTASS